MPSRKQEEAEDDLAETCSFFGTFIENRYDGYPVPVPPGDEKVFYEVYSFCGLIDGEGMASFLAQPQSVRRSMLRSLRKLGLVKLIENSRKAGAALSRSGLSLKRKKDRPAISELFGPFEKIYYARLRKQAYARLNRLIGDSDAFIPYVLNCQRMDKEGGNPFDPKEWTAKKLSSCYKR